MRQALPLVASVLGGVIGGIGIEIFGTPGLIVASVVLVLAIALRQAWIAVLVAIADGLALAIWALALMRCEPTFGRTCELAGGLLGLFVWAGALVVLGIVVAFVGARPRQRTE